MPELTLSEAEWEEVCEAVDFRAGDSEIAARIWPMLTVFRGPVVIIDAEDDNDA